MSVIANKVINENTKSMFYVECSKLTEVTAARRQ